MVQALDLAIEDWIRQNGRTEFRDAALRRSMGERAIKNTASLEGKIIAKGMLRNLDQVRFGPSHTLLDYTREPDCTVPSTATVDQAMTTIARKSFLTSPPLPKMHECTDVRSIRTDIEPCASAFDSALPSSSTTSNQDFEAVITQDKVYVPSTVMQKSDGTLLYSPSTLLPPISRDGGANVNALGARVLDVNAGAVGAQVQDALAVQSHAENARAAENSVHAPSVGLNARAEDAHAVEGYAVVAREDDLRAGEKERKAKRARDVAKAAWGNESSADRFYRVLLQLEHDGVVDLTRSDWPVPHRCRIGDIVGIFVRAGRQKEFEARIWPPPDPSDNLAGGGLETLMPYEGNARCAKNSFLRQMGNKGFAHTYHAPLPVPAVPVGAGAGMPGARAGAYPSQYVWALEQAERAAQWKESSGSRKKRLAAALPNTST